MLEKDKTPTRHRIENLEKFHLEDQKRPVDDQLDKQVLNELFRSTSGEVFLSENEVRNYCFEIYNMDLSRCDSCGETAVWLNDKMIYPPAAPAGMASKDMPKVVKDLYDEAGAVFQTSPKSAAALLRLALQHLLIELGGKGKNINSDINELVDNGLNEDVAKTMHALRIVGNEAVHPGVISVDDEPYIAEALFDLLNQIVDQLITRPRRREELWNRLPESKRKEVEARLNKNK